MLKAMGGACAVVLGGSVLTGAYAQKADTAVHPTRRECETLAKSVYLSTLTRSADDLNDLDFKLSVCLESYQDPYPTGVPLLMAAHGEVADELRSRIEKAISTLPIAEQKKVWDAFHAETGTR